MQVRKHIQVSVVKNSACGSLYFGSYTQEPQKMTWIRKQDQYSNEECTIALQAKQKKRGWQVDSDVQNT